MLHNLEQLDENNHDAIRLLEVAIDANDWQLCKEILRFLHSIDDTGDALRDALRRINLDSVPQEELTRNGNGHVGFAIE